VKIQFCSDLHIEFPENKALLTAVPIKPVGDILILAGDIVPFAVMEDHPDFFNYISDHFKQTFWIPGNHEYYHSDAARYSGKFIEKIRDNISLVNNQVIMLDGIRFIFTTLWSSISPENQWHMHHNMSDFRVIKFNNEIFSIYDFNALHEVCKSFLLQELNKEFSGKTVVVTHHVPTLLNYPSKYKASILNQAFAVEMFDLIVDSSIDYWIYGHSHVNTPEFTVGKTHLLTNQLGYVILNEHQQFKTAVID
jgi:predicted phosphohydrolase